MQTEKIKILYEDESILVIDKPPLITVNKSETTKNEITVADWAEDKFQAKNILRSTIDQESDFVKRAGIVHRLDKETSGVLLIARTLAAFENLQAQFKAREVKKTYIALAHGKVMPEEGEVRAPVGRLPWNRTQFGVVAGGREAVTKYKTLDSDYEKDLTLLELFPQTGRTHQIRVHLKYIGHPIFSDFLYAGRKTAKEDRKILSRVFLHAASITFEHPASQKSLTISSQLPVDLENTLIKLKNRN